MNNDDHSSPNRRINPEELQESENTSGSTIDSGLSPRASSEARERAMQRLAEAEQSHAEDGSTSQSLHTGVDSSASPGADPASPIASQASQTDSVSLSHDQNTSFSISPQSAVSSPEATTPPTAETALVDVILSPNSAQQIVSAALPPRVNVRAFESTASTSISSMHSRPRPMPLSVITPTPSDEQVPEFLAFFKAHRLNNNPIQQVLRTLQDIISGYAHYGFARHDTDESLFDYIVGLVRAEERFLNDMQPKIGNNDALSTVVATYSLSSFFYKLKAKTGGHPHFDQFASVTDLMSILGIKFKLPENITVLGTPESRSLASANQDLAGRYPMYLFASVVEGLIKSFPRWQADENARQNLKSLEKGTNLSTKDISIFTTQFIMEKAKSPEYNNFKERSYQFVTDLNAVFFGGPLTPLLNFTYEGVTQVGPGTGDAALLLVHDMFMGFYINPILASIRKNERNKNDLDMAVIWKAMDCILTMHSLFDHSNVSERALYIAMVNRVIESLYASYWQQKGLVPKMQTPSPIARLASAAASASSLFGSVVSAVTPPAARRMIRTASDIAAHMGGDVLDYMPRQIKQPFIGAPPLSFFSEVMRKVILDLELLNSSVRPETVVSTVVGRSNSLT